MRQGEIVALLEAIVVAEEAPRVDDQL